MQHYSFFRLDGSLAAGEGVGSNLKPRDVEVIAIANMKIISMKGLVEKASGKVCQDDNNSVSYRKKDGKMFSMRRCHVRDLTYSAVWSLFLQASNNHKTTKQNEEADNP